uniref:hypothetical protein n=1 Tax=Bradyrhizobium genomosp. I (2014) TaxID=2683269 RepID=UPI001AEC3D07
TSILFAARQLFGKSAGRKLTLAIFIAPSSLSSASQVQWALALCSRADQVFATQREGPLHSAITELGMRP